MNIIQSTRSDFLSRRKYIQMHPMGRKREAWRSSFFFSFRFLFFKVLGLLSLLLLISFFFSCFLSLFCCLFEERGSPKRQEDWERETKRLDGWRKLSIFGYDSLFGQVFYIKPLTLLTPCYVFLLPPFFLCPSWSKYLIFFLYFVLYINIHKYWE